MITIEKNIPIPFKRTYRSKYPWQDMKVGDSFFIKEANPKNIAAAVYSAAKRFEGKQFLWRDMDGGIRVWRVK